MAQAEPDIRSDLFAARLLEEDLSLADLHGADLRGVFLKAARLSRADFTSADLRDASLSDANLANLSDADLSGADLTGADLFAANRGARLHGASLRYANISRADFEGADLTEANLVIANTVETNFGNANLTGCSVYGISAWGLILDGATQQNLVITPEGEPEITVDNIEVAQFVLLYNRKIRAAIDAITSKAVLILGRFTQERKAVLDALRDELGKRGYLPSLFIIFDFDVPANRDITETVTFARMARFIVADLTDPSSIPKELEAIVPHLAAPVQPLIEGSSRPYAMFKDNWKWTIGSMTGCFRSIGTRAWTRCSRRYGEGCRSCGSKGEGFGRATA